MAITIIQWADLLFYEEKLVVFADIEYLGWETPPNDLVCWLCSLAKVKTYNADNQWPGPFVWAEIKQNSVLVGRKLSKFCKRDRVWVVQPPVNKPLVQEEQITGIVEYSNMIPDDFVVMYKRPTHQTNLYRFSCGKSFENAKIQLISRKMS